MKTLVYSSHNFEKPFLEKAALGKQELAFTEELLDVYSANNTKGFDAISIFTSDTALADVLTMLKTNGIRFITLRSAGTANSILHEHLHLVF